MDKNLKSYILVLFKDKEQRLQVEYDTIIKQIGETDSESERKDLCNQLSYIVQYMIYNRNYWSEFLWKDFKENK